MLLKRVTSFGYGRSLRADLRICHDLRHPAGGGFLLLEAHYKRFRTRLTESRQHASAVAVHLDARDYQKASLGSVMVDFFIRRRKETPRRFRRDPSSNIFDQGGYPPCFARQSDGQRERTLVPPVATAKRALVEKKLVLAGADHGQETCG